MTKRMNMCPWYEKPGEEGYRPKRTIKLLGPEELGVCMK